MLTTIALHVNDEARSCAVVPQRSLLSVLRDDLGLTGAKYGCGDGKCGAAAVLGARQAQVVTQDAEQ